LRHVHAIIIVSFTIQHAMNAQEG